jgi:hypothetical protein
MKLKCRCYINSKYAATYVRTRGNCTLKGYIPCPVHEKEAYEQYVREHETITKKNV